MQKVFVIAISVCLFLMFFVWGTIGNTLSLFTIFFPRLHFLFLAFFIAALIARQEASKIIPFLKRLRTLRYWIFPVAGFLIAVSINVIAFDNIPHVQDEIHYLYMAETMANGQLAQAMPVHYEFFQYVFFLFDGHKLFSIFMPGYPLFLIPFTFLGITFLANPILTAINISLVGRVAQYLFDATTSTVSMFLFLVSPFMMTMGGTWMSHPFTATLTLLSVFSFTVFCYSKTSIFLFVSGMSMGWLVLSRPQNALFLFPVVSVFALFNCRSKLSLKNVLFFTIPLILATSAVASYNIYFTKSPITFVQDIYFNMSEPINGCHSLLPNRGCLHCNAESLQSGRITWARGFEVTQQRVVPLVMETFPHPLFFLFSIFSLLSTINNRHYSQIKIFLITIFLAPLFGYFFFYFNGNVFGPRYLYEGSMYLVVVVASGMTGTYRWLADRESYFWTSLLTSFLSASVVFQAMFAAPNVFSYYQHDFWNVGSGLKNEASRIGIEDAVVFVDTRDVESYGSGLVAMNLGDLEESSIIYVRDLGDDSNSRYMHAMSGRKFYRVKYSPGMTKRPRFTEIEPIFNEEFIHLEMEDKFPPYVTAGDYPDYCNRFPVPDRVVAYLDFSIGREVSFSRGRALYCRFVSEGQSYTFGQYFSEPGVYFTTVAAMTGPVFGDLEVFLEDQIVASIDLEKRNVASLNEFQFEINVSEGLHTFRIGPSRESLPDRNYFMIDFIRFEKSREAE